MNYKEAWQKLRNFIENIPFEDSADLILLNSITMKMDQLEGKR